MTADIPEPMPRTPSEIDAIADAYLDEMVTLSPLSATFFGIAGHDDDIDDFTPGGYEAHSQLRRRTLAALAETTPIDDIDKVTLAAMRERLGLAEETYVAGIDEMAVNVLASPAQEVRDVFDLMPTNDDGEWSVFGTRLAKVPRALDQWLGTLAVCAGRGNVAPRRQIEAVATQVAEHVAPGGYFATLRENVRSADTHSRGVLAALENAIDEAAAAYETLGPRLKDLLLDRAPAADACGRERYELLSRFFLGAEVDLEETYRWGAEELARIEAERADVAGRIVPGGTVADAVAALDRDPRYQLHGTDALRMWMQAKADEAIDNLAGTHFDIPGPVRIIEGMIAPTNTGGIYYTGPSDDFSRPGRMWWSVPKGVTEFSTWKELTTVYHEGVPGHHLQVAQTIFRRDTLNSWRRLAAWTPGYGEGWALYAERLMADLGHLDDPGNRMGMLDGQALRAARVVLDIGVHCGFEAPAEVGGGDWTYDKAWTFLTSHSGMDEATLRFELDRYLGWPGQAPSYKIGERLWMHLRDEVARREGADFDIKAFHRRALDLGSVGLDTLRDAVLGTL